MQHTEAKAAPIPSKTGDMQCQASPQPDPA